MSNREKIALLYNLQALLAAGALSTGDMLKETREFLADSHPAVVALALQLITGMQDLYVNDGNRARWNAFLAESLAPVRQRFGDATKKGEGARVPGLRETFLDLASRDPKDSKLLDLARSQTAAYLDGSSDVDPGLVKGASLHPWNISLHPRTVYCWGLILRDDPSRMAASRLDCSAG